MILALYCVLAKVSDEMYLATYQIVPIIVLGVLLLNVVGSLTFIILTIATRKSMKIQK